MCLVVQSVGVGRRQADAVRLCGVAGLFPMASPRAVTSVDEPLTDFGLLLGGWKRRVVPGQH